MRLARTSHGILWSAVLFAAAIFLGTVTDVHGTVDTTQTKEPSYELYVYFGQTAVWMGNSIRYTVYDTTKVEARFLTAAGEIIVLLPLGKQPPGQYTLPWNGTAHGSPMAGFYTFELYFGDDYAARYQIVVRPLGQGT